MMQESSSFQDKPQGEVIEKKQPAYRCALFDPRNTPEAQQTNDALFSRGPVYGIEVTIPALAARCVANLDPQHSEGSADRAAIEDALITPLPPQDATLATVRPDLDAFGSMAILSLRAKGTLPDDSTDLGAETGFVCGSCGWDHPSGTLCQSLVAIEDRAHMIAVADKFERGGWPGVKELPSSQNPWPEGKSPLHTLGASVKDFKLSPADRVVLVEEWLLTGKTPIAYQEKVEKERASMIAALEKGDIKIETRSGGRIAVVESTHAAGTLVGYSLAPVVIALNPTFRQGTGDSYRKFTIAQFEKGHVDLAKALAELSDKEAGWGGSPVIGGSPQGVSSELTIDTVSEIIEKHLSRA